MYSTWGNNNCQQNIVCYDDVTNMATTFAIIYLSKRQEEHKRKSQVHLWDSHTTIQAEQR